ncbi:MAG: caspase family protein [Tenuifilaceae bacterium]
MRKIVGVISIILLFSGEIMSQGEKSYKSKPVKMNIEPTYEFTLPPNLFVELDYKDANQNGILEAEEKSTLKLAITNKGKGPAQGLKVFTTSKSKDPNLIIGPEVFIRMIKPDETKLVEIPIEAKFDIKSNEHKLKINVTEHFGYDMDTTTGLIFYTLEYQKSQIVLIGVDIFDKGEGTMAITEDGQIQAGEMVRAKVIIQNIGNNVARDVKYSISTTDNNINIGQGVGSLNSLQIGEVKEIIVTISPNKRVNVKGQLPIFLSVSEIKGIGNIANQQLPIALNQRPSKSEILKVNVDFNKLKKSVARVESKSEKVKSKLSFKNIEAIPLTKTVMPDAVAVIIGVENYKNISSAPYATNDAEIMQRYFKEALGVQDILFYTNEKVSGFFFDEIFNPVTGQLNRMITRGETDLFVYYSGHGIPEKDGNNVYLFPSDGRLEMLEKQGYSLDTLYSNLQKLGAKSVTVILDACFSGSSRSSSSLVSENISNTKGVKIRPRKNQPWLTNPSIRVLTSSKDDQTSLGFDATQTGLFTYFFCIGLQGDADFNKDKKITLNELNDFLKANVVETSRKIRGEQTPMLYGNGDIVLVEL